MIKIVPPQQRLSLADRTLHGRLAGNPGAGAHDATLNGVAITNTAGRIKEIVRVQ